MPPVTKILGPGDEAALEAFLACYPTTSMFLRSNLRGGGIVDEGRRLQGTYVAAYQGGSIRAVASHNWLGTLVLQAPVHAGEVARAAVAASGRDLVAIIGPYEQVTQAREGLGLLHRPTRMNSREALFTLDLGALRVPPALDGGRLECRPAPAADMDVLVRWRVAYEVELVGERETEALRARSHAMIESARDRGDLFVVYEAEAPVSMAAVNAKLSDMVQIGGVFTPPRLRSRGYGRAAVAASLLAARSQGVGQALLFTSMRNVSARKAYEALGFEESGDYGIVFFDN